MKEFVKDLHDASINGDLTKLKAILQMGELSVDEPDEDGMTPLLQASYKGNLEIARFLINQGANVNWAKHKQRYTALMFAAIAGKIDLIAYLLSCGASYSAENILKRTASAMAAFVGNYFAVAMINTYIEREKISQFVNRKSSVSIDVSIVEPLHNLLIGLNFSPVKVFIYLSSPEGLLLLKNWKMVLAVLEELVKQYFTPHQTNEPLALKFHILAVCLRRAGEWHEDNNNNEEKLDRLHLDLLIKMFLRGCDPYGLPLGQENFLRKSLVSFPHNESNLWKQVVKQVASVKPGICPTALNIIENVINGFSPFCRSNSSTGIDTAPCACCSEMAGGGSTVVVKRCSQCLEVAYCSVACQKLHWFTHKKYCPILKEHHDSVAKANAESGSTKKKPKLSEQEVNEIKADLAEKLHF